MINITILFFTFILMVTQNILLLNEESLILLCFITFVILGLNNIAPQLTSYLKNQSLQIETALKTSFKQVLEVLQQFTVFKTFLGDTFSNFKLLRTYYLKLAGLLVKFLPYYNKSLLRISYKKRLIFLNKVEEQTNKLFIIILLQRLNKIIKIKKFYKEKLKLKQFLCLEQICLRECIELVRPKN